MLKLLFVRMLQHGRVFDKKTDGINTAGFFVRMSLFPRQFKNALITIDLDSHTHLIIGQQTDLSRDL